MSAWPSTRGYWLRRWIKSSRVAPSRASEHRICESTQSTVYLLSLSILFFFFNDVDIFRGQQPRIERSFVIFVESNREFDGINHVRQRAGVKMVCNTTLRRTRKGKQANQTAKLFSSPTAFHVNFSPFSREIDRVIHNIRAPALSISTFRSLFPQTSSYPGQTSPKSSKSNAAWFVGVFLTNFHLLPFPVRVHLHPSPLGKYFGLVSSFTWSCKTRALRSATRVGAIQVFTRRTWHNFESAVNFSHARFSINLKHLKTKT